MVLAVYPGSFDPITLGHLDIIKRSAYIFDKVIIGVTQNIQKNSFLPLDVRIKLIKENSDSIKNIEVIEYSGLTVDFAKKHNARVIIRGIRNSRDFEYEKELSHTNMLLNKEIQTIFLPSRPEYSFISSSCIKELIKLKSDISGFVPQNVKEYFLNNIV